MVKEKNPSSIFRISIQRLGHTPILPDDSHWPIRLVRGERCRHPRHVRMRRWRRMSTLMAVMTITWRSSVDARTTKSKHRLRRTATIAVAVAVAGDGITGAIEAYVWHRSCGAVCALIAGERDGFGVGVRGCAQRGGDATW